MDDVLNTYLENGLKVVFHKIPNAQIVSCGAWIRQGSKYENDADHGLSHLAEHLLLNPRNESEPDYQRIMDSVSREGVMYNAATTKEYTCFYFTGLTQTLEICLAALAQLVKSNRKFDKQLLYILRTGAYRAKFADKYFRADFKNDHAEIEKSENYTYHMVWRGTSAAI